MSRSGTVKKCLIDVKTEVVGLHEVGVSDPLFFLGLGEQFSSIYEFFRYKKKQLADKITKKGASINLRITLPYLYAGSKLPNSPLQPSIFVPFWIG